MQFQLLLVLNFMNLILDDLQLNLSFKIVSFLYQNQGHESEFLDFERLSCKVMIPSLQMVN
jgi:hypothetical protein